ncbi:MAG TPA: hypothetical protein DDX13_11655 [Marinobacter adhaerens]|jgi:hypothetical protein|nr:MULTISPECIES: hypothetical protein [unclassified Marinobacter]PTB98326.1 hypothetical protein C9993_08125 [Marinobacter sp. Z-F4-2]HAP53013.1 hypothetical protein [Marinobacter adhaerens]HBX37527.1 hypothetical protein [Pseudohongiella sp.]MAK52048.1 hypothetical protein [Marinobacter sp.]MBQ94043.1 hypothetical protein [Marinobacter sp.]|tara:strand:- start:661 stop:1035 length:375 start_codon:yes stop_codon:yes gene_type:complete
MTSLASERSWLLDPSVLKLVHQCRRLIHTEFGVKLHLTEEHLDQQLAEYARKTRSTQLIRTWETLKEQVPQLNIEPEEEDDGLKRNYRGQVIADAPTASVQDHEEGEIDQPRKKKVIYRGQVVG